MTDLSFFFNRFLCYKKKKDKNKEMLYFSLHKKSLLKLNWV